MDSTKSNLSHALQKLMTSNHKTKCAAYVLFLVMCSSVHR